MLRCILFLVASTLVLSLPSAGQSAVIGTYSYDYTNQGNRDGQGRSQSSAGVQITDDGTTFRDRFDFAELSGAVIDSLALTFTYSGAGPGSILNLPGVGRVYGEYWETVIEGANTSSATDDLYANLSDSNSPWTGTVTANLVPGHAFFTDALANLGFNFSFRNRGANDNVSFRLASVSLTVNGTAATSVVPLPAPGLLLLGALGALGFSRRFRRQTQKEG